MNHEALERHEAAQPPSERSFAFVFTAFFLLVALWPLVKGRPWRSWALPVAVAIFGIGLVRPSLLRVLNLWWFRLGMLLNRVVSPLVMGILFYAVVTPFGVVMQWAGKDPLRLRRDQNAASYWIERDPPGPEPESMVDQF